MSGKTSRLARPDGSVGAMDLRLGGQEVRPGVECLGQEALGSGPLQLLRDDGRQELWGLHAKLRHHRADAQQEGQGQLRRPQLELRRGHRLQRLERVGFHPGQVGLGDGAALVADVHQVLQLLGIAGRLLRSGDAFLGDERLDELLLHQRHASPLRVRPAKAGRLQCGARHLQPQPTLPGQRVLDGVLVA